MTTTGELLGRCLRAQGARRVFGPEPIPGVVGLPHVPVPDMALASVLADADGRIGPGPGVAWDGDQTLRLSSRPGGDTESYPIADVEAMVAAVATWTVGAVFATRQYRFEMSLTADLSAAVEPLGLDTTPEMFTLAPSLAELGLAILAGPGVVRAGAVEALGMFAETVGAGVLNTWGAKGVFRWDSPFHLGTGGLQERDLELSGLYDVGLVIAVGIDEDETPPEVFGSTQVLECEPAALATLALNWPVSGRQPARSRLYQELSSALQPLYAAKVAPLTPACAAADVAEVLPPGGLVVADPGPAGLWIARSFPTSEPGSVIVPGARTTGFAAAACIIGALDGRSTIGITTDPLDDLTRALLDLAKVRGWPVTLEVWGADDPDDSVPDAARHRSRLLSALAADDVIVLPLPMDFSHTLVLVDVAGPVRAWMQ